MDSARPLLAGALLAAVLLACSGEDDAPDGLGSSPSATSTDSRIASTQANPEPEPSLADKVVEAREILGRDGDIDPDAITVVSAESTEWPNSAYGCPSHESSYAPGPFAGYRIVLAADGQDYVYTGADDTAPRRCLFLD